MLITACDMLVAFASLLQGIPAAICLLDSSACFPNWSNGIYFPISGNFYICSVFHTVVLSVKKQSTLKPDSIGSTKKVYLVLLIGLGLWTVSCLIGFSRDLLALIKELELYMDNQSCSAQWAKLLCLSSTAVIVNGIFSKLIGNL